MPQEKSVGAVIFRKENGVVHYLLLRYRRKHWDFTKGHAEPEESEEQTLRREAKEETGLTDLKIIEGFKEHHKFVFKQYKELMSKEDQEAGKTVWVYKIVTFYLAETKTKEVTISWEHQDFKWLPFQEALNLVTFKNAKELITKANEFIIKNNL